ncbi:MAG: VanZ family protein [Acidobacteriota bacterium]|nr:VanZ family protein [Acidobacteriota bacterium]
MSRQRSGRRRPVVWPWLLIVLWICVIWGHSLMPGDESGLESQWVTDLLRRGAAWLGLSDRPLVRRLLTDRELLHLVVRKGAHFSEYFVLGVLTFNALRLTFRSPVAGTAALVAIWVCVPGIDETIQRFVPSRVGATADVLLDMCGFACSFILCLLLAGLGRMGRRRG